MTTVLNLSIPVHGHPWLCLVGPRGYGHGVFEFSPTRSKWEQIAETVTERITTGELHPDDKLSEVELTEEFGVDRKTVRKAVAALRDARLVITRTGMGSFVTHPSERGEQ